MTSTDQHQPRHTRKDAAPGKSYATPDVIRFIHQMQAEVVGLAVACLILFALLLAGIR